MQGAPDDNVRPTLVWPSLAAVFALVIAFTFSDDIVEFVLDLTGDRFTGARPWLVFVADCVLVIATAALKWRISPAPAQVFLRSLVSGWWGVGAAVVVAAHLALIATNEHRASLGATATIWVSVLGSLVFVAAMGVLLVSSIAEQPGSRTWLIPLIVGTVVVQLASALWYPVIDVQKGCAGDISSAYFSDMTNIIAVVLLTVGVELAYVRRVANAADPRHRVVPIFTVLWLCVGEVLAFTMLVKADMGPRCGLAAVWHEYSAFVVSAQALVIGLTTVLWLLVTDEGNKI
ncbi:hypothetical protein [Mycolicibacterium sphagni]|uniref:Uncharacterized protein n=1 Tax=Mycolicibacterium sphagni TaxID=1786 RepID=A0A255D5E8_9MYCO|nr:hypothetical protein [Mycolicibacterium sphagni]OYN74457.1 hypothetical protein CG716_28585 [Mycolicibacterium sphagni]